MRKTQGTVPLVLAFLVTSAVALYCQHTLIERTRTRIDPFRGMFYLPSGQVMKLATIGYDLPVADFLWLRSIQAYGASYAKGNEEQLLGYFNVITDLDPKFISAYSFGCMALGEDAQDHEMGLALLNKGIKHNPETYILAYEAAFFSFWTMKDPELARGYVELALATEDCPSFIERWLPFFDKESGRYEAAFQNYLLQYSNHYNAGNEDIAGVNRVNLFNSIHEWYIHDIRRLSIEYEEREGSYPQSLAELEATGVFKDVLWPDWVVLERVLDQIVESNQLMPIDEDNISEASQQFTHTGWAKVPDNPHSTNPHFPGYVIWPHQEPFTLIGGESTENRHFVISEYDAAAQISQSFAYADTPIMKYKEEHGECPTSFANFSSPIQEIKYDPWGGEFMIGEDDCISYCSGMPDMLKKLGEYP